MRGEGKGNDFFTYSPTDNVTLDRDDLDGPPGTETITIVKVRSGSYSYSVHDYTNRDNASSCSSCTKLADSGATVTVYLGSSLPGSDTVKKYYVPGGAGTLWKVFTFTESGSLNKVHTMGNVVTSSPSTSYDDVY